MITSAETVSKATCRSAMNVENKRNVCSFLVDASDLKSLGNLLPHQFESGLRLHFVLNIFPGGCLTTIVDWTSSPMSSFVDTFRKRGWVVAYAFQGVLGLRDMLGNGKLNS